ncbi:MULTISPECIES: hypothetical protein [Nocardia]|uniref:hypothetical protein n=1 Tax=Nocardia TaxID=1817 RepID=UPI002454BA3D|nr:MULTISPECIES: hypothetical protein [Nocardia]
MTHWHNAEHWTHLRQNNVKPTPNQRAILQLLADGQARTGREVIIATGQDNVPVRDRLKAMAMRGWLFADTPPPKHHITYRITDAGRTALMIGMP